MGACSCAPIRNGARTLSFKPSRLISLRCLLEALAVTLLTNDFRGLVADDALAPFSLVCKAVAANGRPTVKLSDNPEKAMGPEAEIARYKRVFGVGEQEKIDVIV